jgi:hypothetical protein
MEALRRTIVVEARSLPDLPASAFPACAQVGAQLEQTASAPAPAASRAGAVAVGGDEGGRAGASGRGECGHEGRAAAATAWTAVREGLAAALRRALGQIAAARPSAAELAEDLAVLARAAAAADAAGAAAAETEAAEAASGGCGGAPAAGGAGDLSPAAAPASARSETGAAASAAAEAAVAAAETAAAAADVTVAQWAHESRRGAEAVGRLAGLLDGLYARHNPARRAEAAAIAAKFAGREGPLVLRLRAAYGSEHMSAWAAECAPAAAFGGVGGTGNVSGGAGPAVGAEPSPTACGSGRGRGAAAAAASATTRKKLEGMLAPPAVGARPVGACTAGGGGGGSVVGGDRRRIGNFATPVLSFAALPRETPSKFL